MIDTNFIAIKSGYAGSPPQVAVLENGETCLIEIDTLREIIATWLNSNPTKWTRQLKPRQQYRRIILT